MPLLWDLEAKENAGMRKCLVKRNGYLFWITTYEAHHKILREIHFCIIESDLEQAAGRARLLNNICIVNVFSNYPVKQAFMNEYPIDLHKKAEKEEILYMGYFSIMNLPEASLGVSKISP